MLKYGKIKVLGDDYMGFFNRKKKKEQEISRYKEEYNKPFDIKYTITEDGRLQIDFQENHAKFGKMYDTTRLIFTNNMEMLNNRYVPECLVSWYGRSDVTLLKGPESGRRTEYSYILADIDITQMQTNPQYCEMVMKELLEQNRVNRYLESGLEDYPQRPCGEYIGGVRQIQNGYEKFFDLQAGMDAHYKPYMMRKREIHKAEIQENIAKNAEIKRLQKRLDELYNNR